VAFPTKLLNEGEEIVLDLRPHWWFMAKATLALLGAIVLGIVVATAMDGDGGVEDASRWVVVVLIAGALLWFASRYAKWVTTNFVVTTDRLIYRVGIVAKQGIEIPLERVNTVFFNQSVFERLLGAGDLSIESGGETGKQTFSDIRKPSYVQNQIYRQMEANNARMYSGRQGVGGGDLPTTTPATVPDHLSVPQQIEKLDELRQRGVLTEAEFVEKKAELLKRM
jgi:membrane protein YdbS with pleckstrin-like domain